MAKSIRMSIVLPTSPKEIYEGWLDSKTHAKFTGGSEAKIDARINGKFTAWDGYISGITLEMEPDHRIVQTWRTTDFPADAADSRLEVILEKVDKGTKMTLIHTQFPPDQMEEYRSGWEEFYFQPMRTYFKG